MKSYQYSSTQSFKSSISVGAIDGITTMLGAVAAKTAQRNEGGRKVQGE